MSARWYCAVWLTLAACCCPCRASNPPLPSQSVADPALETLNGSIFLQAPDDVLVRVGSNPPVSILGRDAQLARELADVDVKTQENRAAAATVAVMVGTVAENLATEALLARTNEATAERLANSGIVSAKAAQKAAEAAAAQGGEAKWLANTGISSASVAQKAAEAAAAQVSALLAQLRGVQRDLTGQIQELKTLNECGKKGLIHNSETDKCEMPPASGVRCGPGFVKLHPGSQGTCIAIQPTREAGCYGDECTVQGYRNCLCAEIKIGLQREIIRPTTDSVNKAGEYCVAGIGHCQGHGTYCGSVSAYSQAGIAKIWPNYNSKAQYRARYSYYQGKRWYSIKSDSGVSICDQARPVRHSGYPFGSYRCCYG